MATKTTINTHDISPLNYKEIDQILSELRLEGSFLRKIMQPDFKSLVFTFMREDESMVDVFFDLSTYSSALYPIPKHTKSLPKGKNLRFMQILRARTQGGYIQKVFQHGSERIIVFHVKHLEKDKYIYIRLWGTRTNVFLCDGHNNILDVFYRRPKSQEFSGFTFELPPKRPVLEDYTLRVIPGDGSFGERLYDLYFSSREQREKKYTHLEEFHTWYEAQEATLFSKRESLSAKHVQNKERAQEYKKKADLLMNIQALPEYSMPEDNQVAMRDFDGANYTIIIDPLKNFIENAQDYYEKKKHLLKENEIIEDRIDEISGKEEELATYWSMQEDASFLLQKGWLKKQTARPQGLSGGLFQYKDYPICVGRSASENDQLLRKYAKGRDWWFHVRDYSGCYVFVICKKKVATLPQDVILVACELAAHYSKGKNEGSLDIYSTQVKNLKRVKKQLGKVIVNQEKTISYRRDPARLTNIMQKKI